MSTATLDLFAGTEVRLPRCLRHVYPFPDSGLVYCFDQDNQIMPELSGAMHPALWDDVLAAAGRDTVFHGTPEIERR